jgi:hypothetical protein
MKAWAKRGLVGLLIPLALTVGGCGVPEASLNQNAGKTIRYEVDGAAAAMNVTYMVDHGQEQDTKVTLPWSKEFTAGQGFQAFVVNAQNAGTGSISCRILIDGKVITEKTSNGQYAVVMCSGS